MRVDIKKAIGFANMVDVQSSLGVDVKEVRSFINISLLKRTRGFINMVLLAQLGDSGLLYFCSPVYLYVKLNTHMLINLRVPR